MRAAVIGSGLIGRSWAIAFARGGAHVKLWDQEAGKAEAALTLIERSLADMMAAELIDDPVRLRARIAAVSTLVEAVGDATHVQENIPERLQPKQALFAEIETLAPPDAVLASSTSAILPSAIFEGLAARRRCLVAHPMNPPHLAPIVELCGAPFTAADAVARTRRFMEACGMAPIVLNREIDGFVMNRLQHALLNEAFRLIGEGVVTATDLDKTVSEGLALRWSFMGPIETIDLNAPDGVADYLARYGAMIHELGRSMEGKDWPADMGERLAKERRAAIPLSRLAEEQIWRDRHLMALAAHKKQAAEKFGK